MPAAAAVLVWLVAAVVLVRLVVVVWRRWVLVPLVLLAVVAVSLAVAVSLVVVVPLLVVVVVWRRWVLAVLGIVVRRRGRCGVVRMMWCVWMPWRSVVLR